ncbi:MAG TPA: type II toxin-antitoxin system PemK/MazF family toxin [Rhizomicrobium sp.]|nr:type II toxin-antitoxin system PemK/MazF family toxin [Rhizomicrobium sp.]
MSRSKFRPALLLADAGRGDWIACQITSNPYADERAIVLANDAFAEGSLQRVSYARPGKLFTANESLLAARVGRLKPSELTQVREAVVALFR